MYTMDMLNPTSPYITSVTRSLNVTYVYDVALFRFLLLNVHGGVIITINVTASIRVQLFDLLQVRHLEDTLGEYVLLSM